MLANSLTKTTEKGLTYDEEMKSGKARRKLGLGPLELDASRSRTDIQT